MNVRTIAVFTWALAALVPSARADESFDADDATKLIRSTVDQAVEVLKNPELQGREQRLERHARLRKISNKVFDWSEMARRSLGVHWRKLNEAERKRFTDTFKEILADHYLGQMDRFQGDEKVTHIGTEESKNGWVVKMMLRTPSRAEVPIHFYVGEDRCVYDVSIEGVILSNHYRGTFDRQLVNTSFDAMMKRLEQKLAVQQRVAEKAAEGS
jgi:phospholipid transport system substrate-binding protein